MARGVRFGRKPKLTAHLIAEAQRRLAEGKTQVDIAHQTIGILAGA